MSISFEVVLGANCLLEWNEGCECAVFFFFVVVVVVMFVFHPLFERMGVMHRSLKWTKSWRYIGQRLHQLICDSLDSRVEKSCRGSLFSCIWPAPPSRTSSNSRGAPSRHFGERERERDTALEGWWW